MILSMQDNEENRSVESFNDISNSNSVIEWFHAPTFINKQNYYYITNVCNVCHLWVLKSDTVE